MQNWKTLSRQVILDKSPYLIVEQHNIELPDGRIIDNWPWVITPDFVNIAAITDEEQFLCFRQIKYAINGTSLAAVGGYINPGERPLSAAKRELLEETGYEATSWESLGTFSVGANRGIATAHFFLARGAHKVAEINSDDLEEQLLLFLNRAEVETAVARGAFKVLPWEAIMALALLKY